MDLLAALKRANDRPDFTGKVVAVYCNSEQRGGVFQDARIVRVGFSNFLVGRRVEKEPSLQERWSNVTCWIAIHDISQMLVFDDIEAARRAYEPGKM
jgi:hypothetical protein